MRRRRCGSFRRALRAEAVRRAELPRPAARVTGRLRCPPYLPVPRPAARTRPSDAPVALSPGECHSGGGGTPRIVRAAPSTRKGTRRSFLTAPQKDLQDPQLTAAQGRPVAAILSEWQWQVNYPLAIDTAYMWPVEANTHQLNDGD